MLKVAVIGGGVVGASVAYHLLRHGARVTVVDRADAGQATLAGAGILPALDHFADGEALLPLLKAARAHYPDLARSLAAEGERDTGYTVVGALQVALGAPDSEILQRAAAQARAWQSEGFAHVGVVRELDARGARELFPLLGSSIAGALYMSGAARVDGRRLLAAFRGAIGARGGQWRRGNAQLRLKGRRVTDVRIDGDDLAIDAAVIAAGAWSQPIAASVGVQLPVRPQRGQLLHLEVPDADTSRWPIVMGCGWNYLVSFPEGRVVAGATREDSEHDARITAGGMCEVLGWALELAPALGRAALSDMRVGMRPVSADGRPILGATRALSNVFFATGHGGYGLEVGPYSGALVADVVTGREPPIALAPFSPDRFAAPSD